MSTKLGTGNVSILTSEKISPFLKYLFKFIIAFCIFYFGTIAIIGLAAPGGYYIPFIDHYFNYVSWLRSSLLYGAKTILSIAGFKTYVWDIYNLRVQNGRGVHIGFDCLGYGVFSFWIAFIIANKRGWIKKTKWIAGGFFLIWMINISRISFLLIAINKHWSMPLGLDHHTWFNIAAYGCIFIMIYFFDRLDKQTQSGQYERA